jgi:hypothetical protein
MEQSLSLLGGLLFIVLVSLWVRTCSLEDKVRELNSESISTKSDCQHRVQMMDQESFSLRGEVRSLQIKVQALESSR